MVKREGQSGEEGVGEAGTGRGGTESKRTAMLGGLIIQSGSSIQWWRLDLGVFGA